MWTSRICHETRRHFVISTRLNHDRRITSSFHRRLQKKRLLQEGKKTTIQFFIVQRKPLQFLPERLEKIIFLTVFISRLPTTALNARH